MKTRNNDKKTYISPVVEMAATESERVFCASGDHEGITIQDWYWAEYFLGDSFH